MLFFPELNVSFDYYNLFFFCVCVCVFVWRSCFHLWDDVLSEALKGSGMGKLEESGQSA